MKEKATLIGGPNDGQSWEVDGSPQEIEILYRVMERSGAMKIMARAKYALRENKTPLEYEFSGSH
jgi:hypothetical protein